MSTYEDAGSEDVKMLANETLMKEPERIYLHNALLPLCPSRSLNIRHTDVLTIFDGRDLMSHVIGQYLGSRERFQVVSGGSEVTIQFQSDPDDSSFMLSQGFLIHYRGTFTH